MSDLKPTPRLRFVERGRDDRAGPPTRRILQQWWAPDLPSYMADPNVGEWRDVPVGVESP